MALKNGCTSPFGITLADTAVLLNDITYQHEPQMELSDNKLGQYYGGRLIKTKVTMIIKGEVLESGKAALQALVNTGNATSESPRCGPLKLSEPNEGKRTFELTAHYFDNTSASFKLT